MIKAIEPKVEYWGEPPATDIKTGLEFIEKIGRLCYKSEGRIAPGTAAKFVCGGLIPKEHLAMVEHSNFVLRVPYNELDRCPPFGHGTYIKSVAKLDAVYYGGNWTAWYKLVIAGAAGVPGILFARKFCDVFPKLSEFTQVGVASAIRECSQEEIPAELRRYTVKFTTDRGVTHELVRHRPCSFAQECLSGDTVVVAYTGLNSKVCSPRKWSLKTLYEYQNCQKRKGRLKLIRLRSVNSQGQIVPGKIDRILGPKDKELFRVKCKSGRVIDASMDHRFLTDEGYKHLHELSVGSRIKANGVDALENREWMYQKYITENNTLSEMAELCGCCTTYVTRALRRLNINKPLSMRKNRRPGRGRKGSLSTEQRELLSKRMRGENNPSWKGDNATDGSLRCRAYRQYSPDICWGCGALPDESKLERHHADLNPRNNKPSNIMFLCQKCHKSFHTGQAVLTVFSDEILSIESIGVHPTYDIAMENEEHNFVANGLVVHNSTRYCDYGGQDTQFVLPWYMLTGEGPEPEDNELYNIWWEAMRTAERAYKNMRAAGASPQAARAVLPNSLKAELVVTADEAEWRHIFKLRCAKDAHPDMQIVAKMAQDLLEPVFNSTAQCAE